MTAASRCTLNRLEVTIAESQNITPCTGIGLPLNKYAYKFLTDAANRERVALHPLTALQ